MLPKETPDASEALPVLGDGVARCKWPWRPYARVVLIDSRIEPRLASGGWREWKSGLTHDGKTVTYAEYGTRYGHGAPPDSRITQLTAQQAAQWLLANFFPGQTEWIDRKDSDD